MGNYCENCGAELPDGARFCGTCGTPVGREPRRGNGERVAALVLRMQKGDDAAFTELFEKTKGYVAACVRLQNVPEESVDDVLQEVFLKVYRSIKSVENPYGALKWMKHIAYNEAIDFHRRNARRVVDVSIDDEAEGKEEFEKVAGSPDDAMHLPENLVESQDVQRILLGFVNELPDEQKSVFFAHFLNELSSAEIARASGISESTVRSRLMRSRRALQEKIDAYSERTGVQLRTFSVAPVLWLLLQRGGLEAAPVGLTAAKLFETVRADAAAGGTATAQAPADTAATTQIPAGTTASAAQASADTTATAQTTTTSTASVTQAGATGAAKSAGWFAAHKALVAIVAAVAVVAGGAGIYAAATAGNATDQTTATDSDSAPQEETPDTPAEEPVAPEFDDAAMANAYQVVLQDVEAGAYDFSNPNFGFPMTPITDALVSPQYALQDIDGDGHPELLVRQAATTPSEPVNQWNVLVFTYKAGDDAAEKLDGVVTLPASTSAGYTGASDLYATTSGVGAYKRVYNESQEGDAATPNSAATLSLASVAVQDSSLVEATLDGTSTPSDLAEKIVFTDITDLSALKALGGETTGATSSAPAASAEKSPEQAYSEAVAACGQPVWEGTLEVLSDADLAQLQLSKGDITQSEYDYLKGQFGSTQHVVLVLNQPASVTATSGDGMSTMTQTQSMVALTEDASGWQAYNGKHVAVVVPSASEMSFPSDASLPIGTVRTRVTSSANFVAAY
jgi:RNA polymerase sigma-70 factor (ECF subfamily)